MLLKEWKYHLASDMTDRRTRLRKGENLELKPRVRQHSVQRMVGLQVPGVAKEWVEDRA